MPATTLVCASSHNCLKKRCNAGNVNAASLDFIHLFPSSLLPASANCQLSGTSRAARAQGISVSLPDTLLESSLHRYTWCTNNMAVSMCHAACVCRTGGEAAEGHRSVHLLCHGFLLSCRGSCCAGAATEGVPTISCIIV